MLSKITRQGFKIAAITTELCQSLEHEMFVTASRSQNPDKLLHGIYIKNDR